MTSEKSRTPLTERSRTEREIWADELLDRLTPLMSALAIVFVLVVVGESMTTDSAGLSLALTITGWVIWLAFAAEFVARMVVAPETGEFLKRNWWQALFLVLPFLRILRLVRVFRFARTGRVLSSAIRSSRSAQRALGSRVGWLAVVSAIAILASSQLLFEFGIFENYAEALHAAALATIVGEPIAQPDAFSQILEVVLAAFSVVVFATLAGTLGAYFLERNSEAASDGLAP